MAARKKATNKRSASSHSHKGTRSNQGRSGNASQPRDERGHFISRDQAYESDHSYNQPHDGDGRFDSQWRSHYDDDDYDNTDAHYGDVRDPRGVATHNRENEIHARRQHLRGHIRRTREPSDTGQRRSIN